jgi:hypothetical protein
MVALTRLPAVPCLSYADASDLERPFCLERQVCEFVLRGIGVRETAIASLLDRDLRRLPSQPLTSESA